jgi:hypothetical protein
MFYDPLPFYFLKENMTLLDDFHWQQHILHRRLELLLMLGLPLL